MSARTRAGWILGAVALLQIAVNGFWLSRDTRPWIWDMALHARLGLEYLDWTQHPSPEGVRAVYRESQQYPPLYHWTEALSYAAAGRTADAAAFPNFLFLCLLLWAVFRMGERIGGAATGLWAALLASFFPVLVWLSRTPLLDFALTALVCAAVHFLLETGNFRQRRSSVLFGLICGLGMLVKWSFLFFLTGPALFFYFQTPEWKSPRRAANFLLAAVVAAAVASIWYAGKLDFLLLDYFPRHAAEGSLEGDPPLGSPVSWIYYLQFLLSYQLFFPLAAPVVVGIFAAARRSLRMSSLAVVWVWLGSSWLLLTLLRNKDPRYSAPLLPAVALLAAAGWTLPGLLSKGWKRAALAAALLQYAIITFPLPGLPERISLGTFQRGTYTWEWQVFSTSYAGFLGPFRREVWPIDSVLSAIEEAGSGTLYVVPDHPYFSAEVFRYQTRLRRMTLQVRALREGSFPAGARDFLLLKSGWQGDPRSTAETARLAREAMADPGLRLLETYRLPDGSEAFLFGGR
ncbi:MAG: glycosyltransferase family 39 protein [Acidobacteria bacterium]|nr:glycosyltransferase family 39 protein [Acidobacteriota bacterium]